MNDKNCELIGFDYDITSHCNLNCAHCTHFSPIAEHEFVTAERAYRELSRIGALFQGKCHHVYILGGEPLLNPEVCEILKIARRCFPVGSICLVTNGLLLSKQSRAFWNTCHTYNIEIDISKYPVKLPMKRLRAYAKFFRVQMYYFRNDDSFAVFRLNQSGKNCGVESFEKCPVSKHCPLYREGRLYHCTLSGCAYKLNKKFGVHFNETEKDYIDIFGNCTAEDVFEFMERPVPFCRYCNPEKWVETGFVSWRHSEGLPEEWIEP